AKTLATANTFKSVRSSTNTKGNRVDFAFRTTVASRKCSDFLTVKLKYSFPHESPMCGGILSAFQIHRKFRSFKRKGKACSIKSNLKSDMEISFENVLSRAYEPNFSKTRFIYCELNRQIPSLCLNLVLTTTGNAIFSSQRQ